MNPEPESFDAEIMEALTALHAELSRLPVDRTREYLEPITEVLMTGRPTVRRYECTWKLSECELLFDADREAAGYLLYRAEEIVMDFKNSPLCADYKKQSKYNVATFLSRYRKYKQQQQEP